jgi:predicted  nucleic acid-binding Zn-ribbon protein
MKDWRALALSLCLGLIGGGGLSAAVGAAKIEATKVELRHEIQEVKEDAESVADSVILLSVAMARVEEQLKAANEKLDNLAR